MSKPTVGNVTKNTSIAVKFKKRVLIDSVLCEDSFPEAGIEFIEASGWKDEGKYSYQSYIFKHDGKFYKVTDSRSGSYYSDYYYESDDWPNEVECTEVQKVEKIVTVWEAVK